MAPFRYNVCFLIVFRSGNGGGSFVGALGGAVGAVAAKAMHSMARGQELMEGVHNSRSATPTSDLDSQLLEQEEMLDKVGAPPLPPGGKFNKAKPIGKTTFSLK